MERRGIMSRLEDGERLLLDGAMGTEIRRRSDKVDRQSASVEDPELVREIHDDHFRAGADIITTNTFSSGRVVLEGMGPSGAEMEHYHRLAAEIAGEERDKLRPDGYVAGGITIPRGKQREGTPGSPETYADYQAQSDVLADAGVDFLLYEFIGFVADCVAAATAGTATGLPVFLGLRWGWGSEGKLESHEPFEELVKALDGLRVDAILPMCCNPPAATGALRRLSESFAAFSARTPEWATKRATTPPMSSRTTPATGSMRAPRSWAVAVTRDRRTSPRSTLLCTAGANCEEWLPSSPFPTGEG